MPCDVCRHHKKGGCGTATAHKDCLAIGQPGASTKRSAEPAELRRSARRPGKTAKRPGTTEFVDLLNSGSGTDDDSDSEDSDDKESSSSEEELDEGSEDLEDLEVHSRQPEPHQRGVPSCLIATSSGDKGAAEQLLSAVASAKPSLALSYTSRHHENPAALTLSLPGSTVARLSGAWLSDELVEGYLRLIEARSPHPRPDAKPGRVPSVSMLSPFFYAKLSENGAPDMALVRQYTRSNYMFVLSSDLILLPVNQDGVHWVLCAVWPRRKLVQVFDSLHSQRRMAYLRGVAQNALAWFLAESVNRQSHSASLAPYGPFPRRCDAAGWRCEVVDGVPLQEDDSACGVFVCAYADLLARGVAPNEFKFGQKDVVRMRAGMFRELATQRLSAALPPQPARQPPVFAKVS